MDLYLGIAVVIATLLGPVLAVWVTRRIDDQRQHKSRQLEVFRALMRSRRSALSADYVTALNTVEVEFAGIASVENAQRELFRHLNLTPQPADWLDRLRRLQTRLLYAMATHLGYKMEQLDVLEGGYLPQAWGTAEEEQTALRRALLELLAANRPLHVQIANAAASPLNRPANGSGGVATAPNPPTSSPGGAAAAIANSGTLYIVEYSGQSGASGFGMVQLANGLISGSDVVGGHYEGNYVIENGRLRGTINMRVPAGVTLVTGFKADADTTVPIAIDLLYDPNGPMRQTISVGGQPVQIVLQKLRDI